MAKTQQVRKITPVGEAKWAHIAKPKAPFKDEQGRTKGDPKYQIDVVFDPKADPTWAEWAKAVMAQIKALPEEVDKRTGDKMQKQNPIKRELDANDQPTGKFYVTFKTSEKFKPPMFDRYGKPLDENTMIGNGSKVRVAYVENVYTAFGGGINFYLNAVQVLELVELGNRSATSYGFDAEAAPVEDDSFDPNNF